VEEYSGFDVCYRCGGGYFRDVLFGQMMGYYIYG
jgi:hypothetical protein